MSTHTHETGFSPSETTVDLQAVINVLQSGMPLDPELERRVTWRAEKVRDELRRKGPTDIAVELLRESRDNV